MGTDIRQGGTVILHAQQDNLIAVGLHDRLGRVDNEGIGGELEPGLEQEWLLTNGTGSFACGTVVGCNTRRYHGLLCAATQPPVGRAMMDGKTGGFKPQAVIKGNIHADKVAVQTLKLTK